MINVVRVDPDPKVPGPRVRVQLTDRGKAQVSITLFVGDGTAFQSTGSDTSPADSFFPRGTYECAAIVSAFNHEAFGAEYDTEIRVGGKLVATAKGSVPRGKHDSGGIGFALEVL